MTIWAELELPPNTIFPLFFAIISAGDTYGAELSMDIK